MARNRCPDSARSPDETLSHTSDTLPAGRPAGRLHHPAGAVEAFKRYRLLAPQGPFIEAAEFSVVKAEVQLMQTEVLDDATRFLSAYPGSEHAPDVRFMRAELYRARKEFAKAAEDYRAVTTGDNAEDALYRLAVPAGAGPLRRDRVEGTPREMPGWIASRRGPPCAGSGSLTKYFGTLETVARFAR